MNNGKSDFKMTSALLFRLLPIQVLLAMIGAVNGIVSSLFASNFVGVDAMSAVGLYSPINLLIGAFSTMLVGGSGILCGRYMGRNEPEKMQGVFSTDLIFSVVLAVLFTVLLLIMGVFDLTGFFTQDETIRRIFNSYLIGQAAGILPFIVGNQLSAFLSLENKNRRTTVASLIYIGVNLLFNYLFVNLFRMEALGLALASSLGMWVFCIVEALYFLQPDAHLRFDLTDLHLHAGLEIAKIGIPGAAATGYQAVRGILVNKLVLAFVGGAGLSAFAAANTLLGFVWALPGGMLAVSRMLISISLGEEDRRTLKDVFMNMFFRFIPLMCALVLLLIALAEPLTRLYYRDPLDPVYQMTVWGFRILPLCMPLSIVCMHFVCYGQASGKQFLVHLLSILDGVVFVAGFTAILIRLIGMNSVYVANVLNGIGCIAVIVLYACFRYKRVPKTLDELMVIPENFGAAEEDRIDVTVRNMEEVVTVAEKVHAFCRKKGIDERRAYFAGLFMEEMAGNVVGHGFLKDNKKHTVETRTVYKDGSVILRIKDDCIPFDPAERKEIADPDDAAKNIGIRMVYRMAKDIQYQNILGLNVLTIRI